MSPSSMSYTLIKIKDIQVLRSQKIEIRKLVPMFDSNILFDRRIYVNVINTST